MKKAFVRRLLVGVLTLTTFFSTLGNTAVYATDGDVVCSQEMGDLSIAEEVESEREKADGAESAAEETTPEEESAKEDASTDSAANESTVEAPGAEASADNASEEAGDQASSDEEQVPAEAGDSATNEATSGASNEAPSDNASVEGSFDGEGDETASDASSESSSQPDEAASTGSSDKTTKETEADEDEIVSDLSNEDFGRVYDVNLSSEIEDVNAAIKLGFSFQIYNAEKIPNGTFTYTLPQQLDFSAMGTGEIAVYNDGKQIGTATIGEGNVMTFHIDENYLKSLPNDLYGRVGFKCKLAKDCGADEDEIEITFSDGTSRKIAITNPVITATKDNTVINSGKATFEVLFDVKADSKNVVITDTVGKNLKFYDISKIRFENEDGLLSPEFAISEDGHTLTVNAGDLKAGQYKLVYEVEALDIIDTSDMTPEEIMEAGYGNTCKWTWDGAKIEHEVTAYAECKVGDALRKTTDGNEMTPDGKQKWLIYIGEGSNPVAVAGHKLVDKLDARMEFSSHNFWIERSFDGKTWENIYQLSDDNFSVNEEGQEVLTYVFPSDAEVCRYRLVYETQIKGELPLDKPVYVNNAEFHFEDGVVTVGAEAKYSHIGAFSQHIEKYMVQNTDGGEDYITAEDGKRIATDDSDRNSATGEVRWMSILTVDGQQAAYNVVIRDTIAPASSNQIVDAKAVSVKMLKPVEVYALDENYQKVSEAIQGLSIKVSGATFEIKGKLAPGRYGIFYSTQDFYDRTHEFPSGVRIAFDNNIQMTIDSQTVSDQLGYTLTSAGLPMYKLAAEGRYDKAADRYTIPWSIYVNKNSLSQKPTNIGNGAKASVTDYLPEKLSYKAGSAVIKRTDGTTYKLEPTISSNDGKQTLTWNFDWEKSENVADTKNYYVIRFETVVDKAYFDELVDSTQDGVVAFSFNNYATGNVGGNSGSINGVSKNKVGVVNKTATFDSQGQIVNYSVKVNDQALDLVDGDILTLTDDLENGLFVDGSIHVYDMNTNEEIVIGKGGLKVYNGYKSFELSVPDQRALVVKYSARPIVAAGQETSDGRVNVEVSNKATLYCRSKKSSTWDKTYTVDDVSADIIGEKGSLRVNKKETGEIYKGLAGAEIGLYRVDLATGQETLVGKQTTESPKFFVLFDTDGAYDSLIFDTLYFYQEIKAPKGYKLDKTKHYFIFKGKKFDKVEESARSLAGSADLKVIDVKEDGATYDVDLENEKAKKDDNKPNPKPTPTEDPTPSDDNPQDETPSETPTDQLDVSKILSITPRPEDLPEVLGASLGDGDSAKALGARKSKTGDRDMSASYVILFAALAVVSGLIAGELKKRKRV